MSVAGEYGRAEQVVADVALLQDMAAGRLDEQRVREAAQVLLKHRRDELPSVSVAVAARLLGGLTDNGRVMAAVRRSRFSCGGAAPT